MLTLLVDMDAVLVDLLSVWLGRYNERRGTNFTANDITQWDIGKVIGDRSVYGILEEPGLYRDLPAFAPAVEVMREMSKLKRKGEKVFDIHIVTAAIAHPGIIPDKIHWLDTNMPFISRKNTNFVYRKQLIRGDAFIDDAPKNYEAWKKLNPHGVTATVTYRYNENNPVDIRGDDHNNQEQAWGTIRRGLLELAERGE